MPLSCIKWAATSTAPMQTPLHSSSPLLMPTSSRVSNCPLPDHHSLCFWSKRARISTLNLKHCSNWSDSSGEDGPAVEVPLDGTVYDLETGEVRIGKLSAGLMLFVLLCANSGGRYRSERYFMWINAAGTEK